MIRNMQLFSSVDNNTCGVIQNSSSNAITNKQLGHVLHLQLIKSFVSGEVTSQTELCTRQIDDDITHIIIGNTSILHINYQLTFEGLLDVGIYNLQVNSRSTSTSLDTCRNVDDNLVDLSLRNIDGIVVLIVFITSTGNSKTVCTTNVESENVSDVSITNLIVGILLEGLRQHLASCHTSQVILSFLRNRLHLGAGEGHTGIPVTQSLPTRSGVLIPRQHVEVRDNLLLVVLQRRSLGGNHLSDTNLQVIIVTGNDRNIDVRQVRRYIAKVYIDSVGSAQSRRTTFELSVSNDITILVRQLSLEGTADGLVVLRLNLQERSLFGKYVLQVDTQHTSQILQAYLSLGISASSRTPHGQVADVGIVRA